MGAMQNRCANMLMLFRFTVSSGIADFLGRHKFKADYWGIFLSFQLLKPMACSFSMMPGLVQYSIAVPDELVQYRASLHPPDQSHLLRPQSSVPLSRCPALQNRDRSFGDGRVRKLERCGRKVSIVAMTTEVREIGGCQIYRPSPVAPGNRRSYPRPIQALLD
jgi:hypothetical protein